MNFPWQLMLPELGQFAAARRQDALKTARNTPLDFIELVGMAIGMIAVTALTRYSWPLEPALSSRISMFALNFVAALPLLALFLGPFHIRRLRRGLRALLDERPPR